MRLEARLKRDWRFWKGLNRTLRRVKTIARQSDNLICDDIQAAVEQHRTRRAIRKLTVARRRSGCGLRPG